ncbi:hypothetical protein HYH02_003107 [Chlamydomonas schloesseri]|uniref:1,4-dihydroxy-2-naphthoate octaprenyltransferase n=1 Tax=Chlamydomonas schloesseri TaxID=2026947 RepID=A0A835WSL4_9CHLO|nr:hypothetical protein HYH02_003107 [Chlamydomonas schloesseri]|eukprot:KAG2452071.1 hypothetical protein HYH02_003107 [Chlamydomonas schloesseri]
MALRRASAFPGQPSGRLTPLASTPTNASSLVVELQPKMKPEQEPSEAAVVEDTGAVLAPITDQPSTSTPPPVHPGGPEQQPEAAAAQPSVAVPFETDGKKLWMAAIKPPMYSVGFVPVLVAAAAVFFVHGCLPWGRVGGLVTAAILVIAWLNLSNDGFDSLTGVDAAGAKPESVVNLLGGGAAGRAAVLLVAKAALLAGVLLLGRCLGAAPGGDPRPAALLAFSIVCGYVYQGPPFRLSYKGLGEPLCFAAFGPSATTAFYLALQPDGAAAAAAAASAAAGAGAAGAAAALAAGVPSVVGACALLVGATTTVILFCSHFHQIAGDIAAGKRSPLVRLGTERARRVLRAAAIATHAGALAAAAAGALPWPAAAATLLAAPAARAMVAFADENHTVPVRVAPLKRFAVKWHILFGLCLCGGLAAARALATGGV